jgi:uncharacterized protein YbjT (DUF2867 family)
MTTTADTILVLGATGTTGRRVTERLTARGYRVRRGSRQAEPPFEWNDPSTWPAVVEGVSAAYVVYSPELALPGAVDSVRHFAEVATDAGVRRLVLLSGRGEPEAQRAEAELAGVADRAGAAWTVVRCSWFAQNFSESFLLPLVLDGLIALPAADIAEPFVDAEDIADVVTVALTEDRHAGRVYELTGPEAHTFAEAAHILSATTGRPVRYEAVSVEDFVGAAVEGGLPEDAAYGLAEVFTKVLDGRNVEPQDGVQRALGRPPHSFRQFAQAAFADGGLAASA